MTDMKICETVSGLLDKEVRTAHMTARQIGHALWDITRNYPISAYGALKHRLMLEDIETYCMFIGYQRSGHSLIASSLNAHPNIMIADELGVLKYILARFSKKQIYHLLLENSKMYAERGSVRIFAEKGVKAAGKYSYKVPDQWQGKFRKLQVIGDKHANGVTSRLMARPWLLPRLQHTINGNMKVFHIVRNPYDNISTISKRLNISLEQSIELYFSLCKTVADVKKQLDVSDLFELRHESYVDDPKKFLRQMCSFLGVDAPDDYLDDCAGIVFKSPRKTRHTVQWNSGLTDSVYEKMSQFPFLEGYSYTD